MSFFTHADVHIMRIYAGSLSGHWLVSLLGFFRADRGHHLACPQVRCVVDDFGNLHPVERCLS